MNLTNLQSDTRFLVFGDSTNTAYGDTDLNRNLNRHYHQLIEIGMQANGDWQVSGTYATLTLEAGVNRYAIPGDILRINRIEIKPTLSDSDYLPASKIDMRNIDGDLGSHEPFSPEYDIRNNYLDIYYGETIEAITNGLKIWVQRDITELSGGSDEPDLPEFARRYLSIGAAYDYCIATENSKAEQFKRDLVELREDVKKHYANRLQVEDPVITPAEENLF